MRLSFVSALLVVAFSAQTVLAQDYIYVSSRGSHDVKRYDASDGSFVDTIIPAIASRSLTQEVLYGPDGMLYVSFRSGTSSSSVHRYDPDTGTDLGAFTTGYNLDQPTKMSWGPDGHLYISQWGSTFFNVAVFDGASGAFIREATNESTNINLMDHAWDADGNLLVVSFGSAAGGRDVRVYDENGDYVSSFLPATEFGGPVNIWFDEAGNFYVVDWGGAPFTADVVRYDGTTGARLQTVASGLQRAEGYAIDDSGLLYIGDWGRHQIFRFDISTGDLVDSFISSGGLLNPNSILFSEDREPTSLTSTPELPSVSLDQNYPNPFATTSTISFTLNNASSTRLEIFDMLGREVARPLDSVVLPPGKHQRTIDGGGLPAGTYIYRLTADGQVAQRTMHIVR